MKQLTMENILDESKSIKKESGVKYIQVSPVIYKIVSFIDDMLDVMSNYHRRPAGKLRVIPNNYKLVD